MEKVLCSAGRTKFEKTIWELGGWNICGTFDMMFEEFWGGSRVENWCVLLKELGELLGVEGF